MIAESEGAIERRAEDLVRAHRELLNDLTALRSKHDLSQDEIARRMGVSQPTVSSFERYDSNPTLSTIRRYALAVGAKIEYKIVDDCGSDDSAFDELLTATWNPSAVVWQSMTKNSHRSYSPVATFEVRASEYVD